MFNQKQLDQTVGLIKAGGVIAYPTESVFGLGCDPLNEQAVIKLLSLKQRSVDQGLILIASNVRQVLPLIQPQHADDLARALKTWPGHFTWVFPKSNSVPSWISGKYSSIAVRVSKHPIVKLLCDRLNHPLVSTSANISKQDDLNSIKRIQETFGDKIGFYIDAPTGNEKHASPIRDAHTLNTIR
jgi:L-threonylcarbamoyladenylate synthase